VSDLSLPPVYRQRAQDGALLEDVREANGAPLDRSVNYKVHLTAFEIHRNVPRSLRSGPRVVHVKILTLATWLCFIAIPAFAVPCSSVLGCGHHGAPAPLIGLGLEGALAIGGALLASKLLRRWKQPK
jgi:hypothetical protein